jgi:hypothetical protein
MTPKTLAEEPLKAFSNAWRDASVEGKPPTLQALTDRGAPLDHPGFGMLGRSEKQHRGKSAAAFMVLAAGPNHFELGGKIKAGQWLDEIVHPAHLASLVELYETICREKSLHQWRCMNMVRNAEPFSYTRVLGAIDDDIGDGRCLAGVWVWHDAYAATTFAS